MPPKKKWEKPVGGWADSDAKEHLQKQIEDGVVKDGDSPLDVIAMFPEMYGPWNYDGGFKDRYARLQTSIKKEKNASAGDYAAFLHDVQLYPHKTVTNRGKMRWHGSDAERYLYEDVKAGVHKGMSRIAFYNSRDAYKKFTTSEFFPHIDQEVRRRKRLAELIAKRDKKEEEKKIKKAKKREEAEKKKAAEKDEHERKRSSSA